MQREVGRGKLDRHTKMDLLIRAAHAGEIIDEPMAKRLQQLCRFRNRIHIKTVEELEYTSYKHGVANAMLDLLEEFRLAVKPWFQARAAAEAQALVDVLTPTPSPAPPPPVQFASEADYDVAPSWFDSNDEEPF